MLDKQISDAQATLADADAALQAASPNYGQLVQQVVPASDVFAALHPDEAFVAIALGQGRTAGSSCCATAPLRYPRSMAALVRSPSWCAGYALASN